MEQGGAAWVVVTIQYQDSSGNTDLRLCTVRVGLLPCLEGNRPPCQLELYCSVQALTLLVILVKDQAIGQG